MKKILLREHKELAVFQVKISGIIKFECTYNVNKAGDRDHQLTIARARAFRAAVYHSDQGLQVKVTELLETYALST